MKFIHVQANELLRIMCKELPIPKYGWLWKKWMPWTKSKTKGSDAIFYAIKNGIFKFVDEIAKERPKALVRSLSGDERFSNALWATIFHRQAKIFSLIRGVDKKNQLSAGWDKQGNNILHMVGKLPPSTLVNRTAGAAFQMQRELQWYKAVESIVPSHFEEEKNKDGKTPRELFTESHKELVIEGEKWMKRTATSCTVVGALIVTIMFAAAFTVPGGNNQNTGYPIFLKDKLFMLFIISDSISLFSSATSVLMFLGILTSRYLEEDFLKSLPSKMIIGLSTLFFSIATMMIAFSAALLIMLHEYSWIFIPAICLASVPVTLFVWMQFPLLVEMAISTFGPDVVNRKIMKRSKLCIYLSSFCPCLS
ncbi:ankyrin repeat-containing protein NPR4-like [Corylus avellana]|uniref:ankyrin repeat-containing protein NPR4-like n=1 Tax=Corylus avellana TaxID=13451 RepID=UPI00286A62F1|nr:ankyrin repeat-containing protein NPR4-like [Corylus avellana]